MVCIVEHGRIERLRWQPLARRDIGNGRDIQQLAAAVVSQQEVRAGAPAKSAHILAVAARLFDRLLQQWVKADVRRKHINIRVGIVVANRKAHPRACEVNAQFPRDRSESHGVRRRIVAEQVHAVSVVGDEQVRVAVIVVVEERDGVRLTRRLACAVAHVVHARGIVALELCARYRMFVDDMRTVRIYHRNLRTGDARIMGDFDECQVAVVQVENIVVPRMVVIRECAKIVVHDIADIDV